MCSEHVWSLRLTGVHTAVSRDPGRVGMQPWALSLPDKELCLREPSIRRQNASGRLWAKAPMAGGGAGFMV